MVCHCKHCQRQAGSAFSVVMIFSKSAVVQSGILKSFHDIGDSGAGLERQFCPECGSPIFSISKSNPDLIVVKAGTLDDTSEVAPQLHIWTESAQDWLVIDPDMPSFAHQPAF